MGAQGCLLQERGLGWSEGRGSAHERKEKLFSLEKWNEQIRLNLQAPGMNWLKAASPEKPNKSGQGCLRVEKVLNSPDHLLKLLVPSALNPLE